MSAISRETRKPVPRQHTFKLELSDDEVLALHAALSGAAQTVTVAHFCRVLSEAIDQAGLNGHPSPPSTHTSDGSPRPTVDGGEPL